MKLIQLTQGHYAKVDDEDYESVSGHKWQYAKTRTGAYARSGTTTMHQFLLGTHLEVDHRDQDGLNNQKANLREATRAQNARNCKMQKNNTSGFRGVSRLKQTGHWMAYIKVDGQRKYIGVFSTKEEAAKARDKVATELHGEFAVLNFPKTESQISFPVLSRQDLCLTLQDLQKVGNL